MSKYDIKIEKTGDASKVSVTGVIDEDVDFNSHVLSGATQLEFDLENIKSINSCGIREWIKWMGTVPAAKITFYKCPKIIVDQINMVQGFLPSNGRIQSFYVPYYSDESGEEKVVLFNHGKEFNDGSVTPPSDVKDSAGKEMEMDVVEAKYFKFIKK